MITSDTKIKEMETIKKNAGVIYVIVLCLMSLSIYTFYKYEVQKSAYRLNTPCNIVIDVNNF